MMLWNLCQNLNTPQHHRRIALWLEREGRAAQARLMLLAFRGAGKSSLVAVMCAWMLLRFSNRRILILSATEDLATRMSNQIRSIIEQHPLTGALMPKKMRSWSKDRFRVVTSTNWRDDSVVAEGITATITGMRADIIIADDIETPDIMGSPQLADQLRQKLSELEYIITPKGMILFIGTPHGVPSLYDPDFASEHFDTRNYARLCVPLIDEKGDSVWPQQFSDHRIKELRRRTSKQKFRTQMLLDPGGSDNDGLPIRKICWYDADLNYLEANGHSILKLQRKQLISGSCVWDPAFGRADGCASVVACVFVDANGIYYLHDALYLTNDDRNDEDEASAQCKQVVAFARRNYMPHVYVENNGIGQFLPGLLRRTFHETGGTEAVSAVTAHCRKNQRILSAFEAVMMAKRLYMNERLKRTRLQQEFEYWRLNKQNKCDGIDAVAHCLLQEPVRFGSFITHKGSRPKWRYRSINEQEV